MPDQGNVQSSLRQAVDRILGFSPGGQGGQQGGAPQQTSDFLLGQKPMMSDISSIRNVIDTPVQPPKDTAALSNTATVAAPASVVSSAPSTGTDPNAALYSWTTPREREAAAAAAKQGIDYWGTTSPESRAVAFKSQDAYDAYKWKGQEWNDPLARQIYQQFNPNEFVNRPVYGGGTFYDTVLKQAQSNNTPQPGTTYHTFINPVDWGGTYGGDTYNQMKDAYTKAGGLAYGPTSPYGK